MSTLDEALRALEKEDRPSMAADVLHAWAQDVLRLLTTRQEVAPVAVPEGWALVPIQSTRVQRIAGQLGITTTCAAAVYREMVAAAPTPPSIAPHIHDDELPGMWSASDFTGGDPDERSHAARTAEQQAPVAWLVEWTDEDDGETVRVSFEYKRGAESRAQEVGGDARVIPLYTSTGQTSDARDVRLTDTQIEAGWRETFSTNNPFCPCDLKSFMKAVHWAKRAMQEAGQ